MSVVVLRYLAMIFGPAITSTARPAATFLAVQITVVALVYRDLAAVPEWLDVLVSVPVIAFVGVLAALEMVATHDPDIAAILRDLNVDRVAGAFGALSAALLFSALGLPEAEAMGLVEGQGAVLATAGGVFDATGAAVAADFNTAIQVVAIGLAVALNIGLTRLRAGLLLFVDEFRLGTLWARIETGGVVGVLILLPLFPLVVLAFLTLLMVGLALFSAAVWSASKTMDQRFRTPCKECGHRLRVEASRCPQCGDEREPTARPSTGLRAAYSAFRGPPA